MKNVMIDIETMGVENNAAIISIGAVEFDVTGLGNEFYRTVHLESSCKNGGVISPSTVLWWMDQDEKAKKQLAQESNISIEMALNDLNFFLAKKDQLIWANSPSFDCVILKSAYENAGAPVPWFYNQERDFRTFKSLYPGIQITDEETAHNALCDARWQARYAIEVFKILESRK